jgi:DNA-damage-inducible protein J
MAQVNIRIDDTLKDQADSLFEELGMNMSTAVNVFIRQTLRERGIPFAITVAESEPLYGEEKPNRATLEAMQEVEDMISGKIPKHGPFRSAEEFLKELKS